MICHLSVAARGALLSFLASMKAGAQLQVAGARSAGPAPAAAAPWFRLLLAALLCLLGAQGVEGKAAALRPGAAARVVNVGVILDRTTLVGNISWTCMELALEDFYADAAHARYRTRVSLHLRDTAGPDAVDAASAGVDLLKNVPVQAIVGPQTSTQAKFLAELGGKASVPIISFSANSPSRSPSQTPCFIRTGWNDSAQAEAIASLVQRYNWRDVVPVFEDDDGNTRFIPDLVDALRRVDTRVSYRCRIHPSAGVDELKIVISRLKDNWTSVFVVRMSYPLALKFFQVAKGEGMMEQGFVWITAYGLGDIFDVVGSPALGVMGGVLAVEPYINDTMKLQKFGQRWREKYQSENPGTLLTVPMLSGLYAYDTIWALALAAEVAGFVNSDFVVSKINNGSTDLDKIGPSRAAEKLGGAFLKVKFSGMSGEFIIQDMQFQLVSTSYRIINVVGRERRTVGFWSPQFSLLKRLENKDGLDTIMWPGGSKNAPRGWVLPANKTLKIGVPVKSGFEDFIRIENGTPSGFSVAVFKEVIKTLPYNISISYEEFEDVEGNSNGTYDELVYKVYLKEYDAVVGDITILANRSLYVDFTLPYTETGVRMLVPVRDQRQKTAWTFLRPLSAGLWLGTGAFIVFTGFVVWSIEHRTNNEFSGPTASQIGSAFYFSFSTLVFAHRERVMNNLSRITVVVWLFVVLILQQSYTASLSSILTVEQLRPTVSNLDDVVRQGAYVGYLNDSFLPGFLKRLKINESKMIALNSPEEYNDALSTGRVAVIVDEIPYLKIFLKKYCNNYTMVGPTYKFDGFGYAFPIGSPLTPEISRGILQFASSANMSQLEKQLYGDRACPDKDDSQTWSSLTLQSFLGLFIITGSSSLLALILHVVITFSSSSCGLLAILSKIFHEHDSSSITPSEDEARIPGTDRAVESPCSHTFDDLDSDTDTEGPPEEGTAGREVSTQDPHPQSFAETCILRDDVWSSIHDLLPM